MRLIAQKTMRYATRRLTVGDEFEASDKDGRLLMLARAARACGAMDEEDATELEEPVKKRRYKRRDLQAED